MSGRNHKENAYSWSRLLCRYGVIAGSLQIYLIVQNVWKFVRFAELPWPNQQTPTLELNIFIGLNGKSIQYKVGKFYVFIVENAHNAIMICFSIVQALPSSCSHSLSRHVS